MRTAKETNVDVLLRTSLASSPSLSLNSLQTEHKLMIQTAIDSQIAQLKSDFNVTTNGELGK